MVFVGCLMTTVLFAALVASVAAAISVIGRAVCRGAWVRHALKAAFINSMSCRRLARVMGSDLLD